MRKQSLIIALCLCCLTPVIAQQRKSSPKKDGLEQAFLHPPESAKPWVFWYWMQGAVSRGRHYCRFAGHEAGGHSRSVFDANQRAR
ncbi:hypothetical protein ACFJIV_21290 [Mucilaginibacter sp. UC70_90]